MHGLRNYPTRTDRGVVVYTAERQFPRVLIIHGFKRRAGRLLPWAQRIPDLGFVHLPGHSRAPAFEEVSVQAWADGVQAMVATFPEPPLIIGESLGAIVAMSARARAVIAVEPLLSCDNLWPLRRTISDARARGLDIGAEDEAIFNSSFEWVLERISAPTLLLAGTTPLLPEREVWPEPSLLTDEDFATYAKHPLVQARRIPGGHSLLDTHRDDVMEAAAEFMTRHGFL